jgi:hypothetical protein
VEDRGDVLSELRRLDLLRPGEWQMKIHSKIFQGEDGHLYFASLDEAGEKGDGRRGPTWGSHLWRLRLPENRWEHLLAAPEGLIAVAAGGGYVYALGYFGHVLYQYDGRSGRSRSRRIGAVGGHISRNFLADHRGHAYVPRLAEAPGKPEGLAATLVEVDEQLAEVGEVPIDHYTLSRNSMSHGIVAFQPLRDRSLVFATDKGFLYRIVPRQGGPALVRALGWFHPKGEMYVSSLFTYDGQRHLLGASRRFHDDHQYEWLVYDLETRSSKAVPLEVPAIGKGGAAEAPLLYGSMTRDDQGSFYLGGTGPVLYQLRPPR